LTGRRLAAAFLLGAVTLGCGAPRAALRPAQDGAGRLAAFRFRTPVDGPVSSGFGGRGAGHHAGVDILAPRGVPVRASEGGTVVHAGSGMRGYGNSVVIDHGGGVTTLYGHLEAIRVESGDAVPAGAVIGTVGRSGNATTYHVHFEIRVDGESVDPLAQLTS
jgi:murein DD-endopeptidase MepM/ murein hydrolase activator NlpD